MSGKSVVRTRPEDAIQRLVSLLPSVDEAPGQITFVVLIDDEGCVGEIECLAHHEMRVDSLAPDLLFGRALNHAASAVLLVSRADHDVNELYEDDIEFSRRLISGGEEVGMHVFDHVLAWEGSSRRMREAIGRV